MLQVVSLTFFGNAAARRHFNCIDDKVTELVVEVKRWPGTERLAFENAKKAEKQAFKAEEARKRAKSELVST